MASEMRKARATAPAALMGKEKGERKKEKAGLIGPLSSSTSVGKRP
jgi:hypothetical protein